ncbi:MAG: EAL domain-containing protein, partial [Ruminococcaceae bacterium]|nr:EAL domain-containing protein [Oscillospiraceae bacterium]
YGFITDLDKYVWEEVCKWQKKWIDKGHTPLPISVNVSQMDIFTLDVPAYFEMLMEKYKLPTDVVKIEITESAYVDNNSVAETVKRLRERGFLVLMDDFGSGYSSLNMLRNLNVDIIKLDAQFLRMSGDDRKGIHIMESVVNMAKTMGVPIIVEGVETREESNFLAGLGCRYVQGYFFYRPMGVEDFEKLIANPKHIDTRGFRFKAREQFHTREFLDQNVFSDTVLNNILGPVAFYFWHGRDVDVVRFNQQFCDEAKIPHTQKNMNAIQRLVPQEDLPGLYELLEKAIKDPLNGATGEVRINRPDGTVSQFRVHFFFLEEDENGKRFYGSIHDLTRFITLNDHMRLLSQISPDTVVFMRKRQGKWSYHVVVHGLADYMGVSKEQLQNDLSDEGFYARVEERAKEQLLSLAKSSEQKMDNFSEPFLFTGADGRKLWLRAWFYGVHDEHSGVEYILILRRAGD